MFESRFNAMNHLASELGFVAHMKVEQEIEYRHLQMEHSRYGLEMV
jgi:hypothetical protein